MMKLRDQILALIIVDRSYDALKGSKEARLGRSFNARQFTLLMRGLIVVSASSDVCSRFLGTAIDESCTLLIL